LGTYAHVLPHMQDEAVARAEAMGQVLKLDASGAGSDLQSGGFTGSPFPLSALPTIQTGLPTIPFLANL